MEIFCPSRVLDRVLQIKFAISPRINNSMTIPKLAALGFKYILTIENLNAREKNWLPKISPNVKLLTTLLREQIFYHFNKRKTLQKLSSLSPPKSHIVSMNGTLQV